MSQKAKILDYMMAGNSLTPMKCIQLFGCTTLSQRIGEIKRLLVETGNQYYVESKQVDGEKYCRYWLVKAQ